MKQVIQNVRSGELKVTDVPCPMVRARGILVRTAASIISAGTERSMMEFAGKNLLLKAQSRPDLVRQVLDKVQRDGLLSTYDSVRNRLDQPGASDQKRLGAKFWASPVYADGRIYCLDEEGTSTVLAPGKKFEKLATNKLDENAQASPAIVDGVVFLRTAKHLYRIEQR